MFLRTGTGRSNLHLFYGVDAIVYVEGGNQTLSQFEAYAGKGATQGLDIKFWSLLFSHFKPQKKFKFLGVGSKETLKRIAADIRTGQISKVHVCMDRDLDSFLGQLLVDPNVLYTAGYSWENDVWTPDTIEEVFYSITPILQSNLIRSRINELLSRFYQGIEKFVGLEILLRIAGMDSMLGSSTGGVYDQVTLTVDRARIRQLVTAARRQRTVKITKPQGFRYTVANDCKGHLISFVAQAIIRHLYSQAQGSRANVPSPVVNSLGIDAVLRKFRGAVSTDPIYQHYRTLFAII